MTVGYLGQREVEVAALKASFTPLRNCLEGHADATASRRNPKVRLHVPDVWLMRKHRPSEELQHEKDTRLHSPPSITERKPEHSDKVNMYNQESLEEEKSDAAQQDVRQSSVETLALESIYLGGYGSAFEQLRESEQKHIVKQLCQALQADINKRIQQRSQPAEPWERTSPELPRMDAHARRASGKPAQAIFAVDSLPDLNMQQPDQRYHIHEQRDHARQRGQLAQLLASKGMVLDALQDHARQQEELEQRLASKGMVLDALQDHARQQDELAQRLASKGMVLDVLQDHARQQEELSQLLASKGLILDARGRTGQSRTWPDLPATAPASSFQVRTKPDLPSPKEEQLRAMPEEAACSPDRPLQRNAWPSAQTLSSSISGSFAPQSRMESLPCQQQIQGPANRALPEGLGAIPSQALGDPSLMESLQLLDICSKLSATASLGDAGDGYCNDGFLPQGFRPPPGLSGSVDPPLPLDILMQIGGPTFSL